MKKVLSIVLCLAMIAVLCAGFAGCSKETGTFTVGFDDAFPPMGFVDDSGNYVGFDLDLAKEVANRLGLKYVPQPIDWGMKTAELESGKIDCIWNGFTITGRENDYTWSEPYLNNSQVFVVPIDSDFTDLASLAGSVLAVQEDSSAQAAVEENADFAATLSQVITTQTNLDAFLELDTGKVSAILMDEVVARYNMEQNPGKYKLLDEPLSSEEYAIGFLLGNTELRDKVSKALGDMAADGTMKEISEKWFGKDITTFGK